NLLEIKKVDEKLKCKAISAYIYDGVSEDEIDFTHKEKILFVGGFAHTPNVDAIKWFDEAIMPRVKTRRDDIKLVVVGSNATGEVLDICKKDYIEYKGFVSDEELDKLYSECRVVVAPLRYGAGIKGKIIEAMSKGCAIITTKVGAEGIDKAEKFMKVVDGAQEFANAIVKLYDDTDTLSMYSRKSRQVINDRFTEDRVWDIIFFVGKKRYESDFTLWRSWD
ncbi:MAG: glycosyltransferase family 4 protein, partial [Lachnospiraceae bacterium]|nr:glycosyltransferase family 4 protein [Lachnospiraceae bacterium]